MLESVLAALAASELPRAEWELIVADDGSTDGTADVAARSADRVVAIANGPRGPADARNAAAAVATADILVFIDADACVAPATLRQFASLFQKRPELGAVFGAYDTTPRDPGFVSQYRNLLHHYTHTANAGPAVTFWAGCGAIRRELFVRVGGFDADRYRRPQIEDIELGYRLAALGVPIVLAPEIQVTHLKRWTLLGGFVTDVRDRGVPWMQLLLERRELVSDGALNVKSAEKVLTVLTSVAFMLLAVAIGTHVWWPAIVAVVMLACVAVANRALVLWFAKTRGVWFALRVVPMRYAYYVLNALSAAWVIISRTILHRSPQF